MGGTEGLTDASVAMVTAMFGIQAALRLRFEEVALRVEPILATVDRPDPVGGQTDHDRLAGAAFSLLTLA